MNNTPRSTNQTPPASIEKLLNWCLPSELKDPILGDLSEEFYSRISTEHYSAVMYWYTQQAFKTCLQYILKTQRGLLMFLFALILFVVLMIMGMALAGGPLMFIDIPSLLAVLPTAIVFGIGATSLQSVKDGISIIFSSEDNLEKHDYLNAAQSFNIIGTSGLWTGLAASILGWVAMAVNIKSEEFASIFGPALAVSVLTIFYAVVLKVICFVAEQKVRFRMNVSYI